MSNQNDVDVEMGDGGSSTAPASTATPASRIPLFSQTPPPRSSPHPSQDLVALFGLQGIASTVARRDAITNEKINKLRKSYEGKVKGFALPGRNKPTDKPGELLGLMEWPDENWHNERVYGKELERAESAPALAILDRALAGMQTGRLPAEEHDKWRLSLALEEPTLAAKSATSAKSMMHAMLKSSAPASAPVSPASLRGNKKRRHDEVSGLPESYDEDVGYSTGGDRRVSATKKRKTDGSFDSSAGYSTPALGVGV